jgi:hypothetical protein
MRSTMGLSVFNWYMGLPAGATEAVRYLGDNGGDVPFGFEDYLDEDD